MKQHFICPLSELSNLTEQQTRGFTVADIDLFIVKLDNEIIAYRNNCPHLGVPLNWQPDTFLSLDNTHIQCSTHGALFTLDKGDCIAGPCVGQSLQTLTTHQDKHSLFLTLPN